MSIYYELANGKLTLVEEITTPKQTAIVRTAVCNVVGYDSNEELIFDTVPEREERDGYIAELHYTNGQLIWVYSAPQLSIIDRMSNVESDLQTTNNALAEVLFYLTDVIEQVNQNTALTFIETVGLSSNLDERITAIEGGN
ncbi:hypothetical protein D3C76_981840 [compost metagenome]